MTERDYQKNWRDIPKEIWDAAYIEWKAARQHCVWGGECIRDDEGPHFLRCSRSCIEFIEDRMMARPLGERAQAKEE